MLPSLYLVYYVPGRSLPDWEFGHLIHSRPEGFAFSRGIQQLVSTLGHVIFLGRLFI